MEEPTSSQCKAITELEKCLECNQVAFVCGPERCGKKYISYRFLSDKTHQVYNLPEEIEKCRNASDLRKTLEEWILRVEKIASEYMEQSYVLITGWEYVYILASSTKFGFSSYGHSYLIEFTRSLEKRGFKSIIPVQRASAQSLVNVSSWLVDITIKDEDVRDIIGRYCNDKADLDEAVSFTKVNNIEEIKTIASQAAKGFVEGDTWIKRFHKAQQLVNPAALDSKKKVTEPIPSVDMLGIDDAIEEIKREVINPIIKGDPAIPICKGVLLFGPPGAGKTTTLRWLSHRLDGKVYVCERNRGDTLISSFTYLMREAVRKAPAIVVIDDIDSILDKPDAVRELLVTLDGINMKGRENVTVVMTCMDISLVPSALHRGGRLERCIEFKYPSSDIIQQIIQNRFKKSIEDLQTNNPLVAANIELRVTPEGVKKMVGMVNGWSPSNIHLLIDTVIRHAVVGDFDFDKLIGQEVQRIKSLESRTSAAMIGRERNADMYA